MYIKKVQLMVLYGFDWLNFKGKNEALENLNLQGP